MSGQRIDTTSGYCYQSMTSAAGAVVASRLACPSAVPDPVSAAGAQPAPATGGHR